MVYDRLRSGDPGERSVIGRADQTRVIRVGGARMGFGRSIWVISGRSFNRITRQMLCPYGCLG
jgi:hypothetical protein